MAAASMSISTPTSVATAPDSSSAPASSSSATYRRWEPLPKIEYGFAVSPFLPELESLDLASVEGTTEGQVEPSTGLAAIQSHLIGLEVGDEVYIFEQLGHADVRWVRGYVVSTTRVPTSATTASSLSDYSAFPSTNTAGASLQEEPQVYVGIFPRAHVHVKESLDDAEMRLAEVYANAKEEGVVGATAPPPAKQPVPISHMETLPEEDENVVSPPGSPLTGSQSRAGDAIGQVGNALGQNKVTFDSSRQSFILQDTQVNEERPPPPLPSLKCGDETKSGALEPLVDEIACALREWSALMYVYLSRRDYALFHAVREHIEVLHIARRQLLAQTLSEEEVGKLRRECVARLVKGNVQQGLDVIVRHPGRGGLVDVDFTGKESDPESWISGIRLYALQTALAYVDQQTGQDSSELGASNAFGIVNQFTSPSGILGGPVTNTNSMTRKGLVRQATNTRQQRLNAANVVDDEGEEKIKYFHVYLDVRAFVASPCLPGETAELYFSLYNKAEARFLTEEYCVILNHQGVPARELQGKLGKMRALFTDLSFNDMQDLNIVCRIVRNGAMRVSNTDSQRPSVGSQYSGLQDSIDMAPIDGTVHRAPGFRSSRMTNDRNFRRPFGCAVVELGQDHRFKVDAASSGPLREHVMPIFTPVNEAAFSTLHQDIIASRVREFEKSPRADLIAISVKVFHGEKTTLIRENPSLLQDAPLTARLGFPDVVFPGDTRNEAYIKLWSGEFFPLANKMPGGNTPRNIQISVEVRNIDGTVLDTVISRGAGEPLVTQFDSTVFYHQNAPTWGELLKLQLPNEVMEKCHLFFSFRHRSSKEEKLGTSAGGGGGQQGNQAVATSNPPFAHAYLPLFEANTAFIPDGSHTLLLWRTSRPTLNLNPDLYFALPPTVPVGKSLTDVIPTSLANVIQPLRDVMTLRTFLVSARYTQNEVLLKLLQWEKILMSSVEELKAVLIKFAFVGEVEIVKFLRDIFDALFGIVVNPKNGSGELDDLVFNSLVTVLGIVQDRRFNNFRATLDVYIDQHYHSQTAHTRLMASMTRLLADPAKTEMSKDLRSAIKVWPYLFKFIVRSRENQRGVKDPIGALGGAVSDHLETSFKRELDQLLRYVNRLMATSKPSSIIGTQTLALQNFAGILPELARVFAMEELAQIETAFADSIFMTKGRMAVWKLLHILHVTHDALFDDHASRSQMLPSIVRWVRPHLGRYEETSHTNPSDHDAARDSARMAWVEAARLGVTIIAVVVDKLQVSLLHGRKGSSTQQQLRQEQDNVDYVLSMMPKLLETYKELDSPETKVTLERHRSPSTITSSVPVIFPSSYPFPLIARKPAGQPTPSNTRSSRRHLRKEQPAFVNCGLGEIAAVLTVLVMLSPRRHLAGFLDEQLDVEGPERLSKFLFDFFEVTTSILLNEAYPSTWLNINILAHQMVLKMADPLASLMVRDFIPPADKSEAFNTQLWRAGLNMLLTLLSSEQLVIERFKPQRRRAVWRLAGDIRGEGAQIFAKLWNSIGWPDQQPKEASSEIVDPGRLNTGGFQVQFVPSLVEPVLELCLSHHDELRTCAVRVLATMITSEWHLNGDFSVIEAEIIDKLDVLFIADTQGDEISRAFFIGQLRSLFDSPHVDARLQEQVHTCLISVNRFLDLLLSVRSLPLEEGFEDDRVSGTLKLLGFLRQANRVTAFSTHVLRLVNLHLENHNYVEAALTLKLHADLHTWELDSFVEPIPDLDLPRQSHFARKETIYMLILDYLSKGQAWEISVDICRELAREYEYRSVDYTRLSDILTLQASLFQKIGTEERTFPNYFRVAYYGSQWPVSLQSKNFVYRGLNWEKFSNFCERLHQKHPKATLIKSNMEPNDEVRFSTSMFIQIMAVTPEPDRTKDVFVNPEAPPVVRAYYEHNTTDLFSFTRPLLRKPTAPSSNAAVDGQAADAKVTEVANLWVEKTYLRVEDSFPTVLRRSEIADIKVVKISPIENALLDVDAKVKELDTLQVKFVSLSKVMGRKAGLNTNRLSMALNGAVDAPINGGIPTYKRAFFSTQYVSSHPEEEPLIHKLREAIDSQTAVIYQCLLLHSRLCPPEMRPFHDTLETFFKQNFAEEIGRLKLDTTLLSEEQNGSLSFSDDGHGSRGGPVALADGSQGSVGGGGGGSINATMDGRGSVISPLQRHIAYLSQQSQPIMASPTSQDNRMAAAASNGTPPQATGSQTVPPLSSNFAPSLSGGAGGVAAAAAASARNVNTGARSTAESVHMKYSSGGDTHSTTSRAQGSLLSKVTENGIGRASRMFGRKK